LANTIPLIRKFFSTNIEKGIQESDIIFVSVNTPTKTFGAGMAADLQYWENTARQILNSTTSDKIIVEKSTLPVRAAQAMERILFSTNNGVRFEVLSNPEFLAEGTAIQDLEHPDRVMIGSRQTESGIKARNALAEIYAHWVPPDRIMTTDIWK
jgi:UDPglucose 6-dehydrogenase